MADVHTKKIRSYNMSRIKGQNTKPEILLRKALWSNGYRYSLKSKLPGKPDIVLRKYNLVVFVDGCFWHGCPKHFRQPSCNQKFWSKKIAGNIARDKKNTRRLKGMGWAVMRFWEHDIQKNLPQVLKEIKNAAERRLSIEGHRK